MRSRSAASFAADEAVISSEFGVVSELTVAVVESALAYTADPLHERGLAKTRAEAMDLCFDSTRSPKSLNAETSARALCCVVLRRCGTETRLVSGDTRSIKLARRAMTYDR